MLDPMLTLGPQVLGGWQLATFARLIKATSSSSRAQITRRLAAQRSLACLAASAAAAATPRH